MTTAGTEGWRQKLGRALVLATIAYVLVAATAGTISFILPYLPKPAPLVSIEDFAKLLKDDLRRGGVIEYCPSFHCFDRDRGYQGYRTLAN
ncbi:hypothetical protein [Burkholderia phage FLC9]|nr:hypothetical protein [Burkholderia phage FLC9]